MQNKTTDYNNYTCIKTILLMQIYLFVTAYLLILCKSNQPIVQEFSRFKPWFQLIHHSAVASSANSKETRKRKVEEEIRKFNKKWTSEYFFIKKKQVDPCV